MLPLKLSGRWHRFRVWAIDHVSLSLLEKPVALVVAIALVGLGAALVSQDVQPNSVVAQVPKTMVVAWSLGLLSGGIATAAGILARVPWMEWVGQLLTGYGCGFYAVAVSVYPAVSFSQGGVIIFVFSALSLVSFWRAFLITMEPWVRARQARELARRVTR